MTDQKKLNFLDSGKSEQEYFAVNEDPRNLVLLKDYLLDLQQRREEFKKATCGFLKQIKNHLPWVEDMVYENNPLFNVVLLSVEGIKYCVNVKDADHCTCVLVNGDRGSLIYRLLEEKIRIKAIEKEGKDLENAFIVGSTLFENFGYNYSASNEFVMKGINEPVLTDVMDSDSWMFTEELMGYCNTSIIDGNEFKECVQIRKVSSKWPNL